MIPVVIESKTGEKLHVMAEVDGFVLRFDKPVTLKSGEEVRVTFKVDENWIPEPLEAVTGPVEALEVAKRMVSGSGYSREDKNGK